MVKYEKAKQPIEKANIDLKNNISNLENTNAGVDSRISDIEESIKIQESL
jgi:hypothetical protein